jgi:hypothetical protein
MCLQNESNLFYIDKTPYPTIYNNGVVVVSAAVVGLALRL